MAKYPKCLYARWPFKRSTLYNVHAPFDLVKSTHLIRIQKTSRPSLFQKMIPKVESLTFNVSEFEFPLFAYFKKTAACRILWRKRLMIAFLSFILCSFESSFSKLLLFSSKNKNLQTVIFNFYISQVSTYSSKPIIFQIILQRFFEPPKLRFTS